MKNTAFRRLAALALALFLCTAPLLAAPSVPDPTAGFYAGDFAGVLSDDLEQYIIDKNQALASASGAQIVVVTVDFLDGYDIVDYAVTLFNSWKIGSSEYNNGYLILLAIFDENYYSLPGKGLEDVFDGGTIDELQWNYLEEDFAAGDYDKGVRAYFDAVLGVMEKQYGSAPASSGQPAAAPSAGGGYETAPGRPGGFGLPNALFLFVLVIILLAVILSLSGLRAIRSPYRRRWFFWGPMVPRRPRPPRPPRPPYGGFGGPRRPGGPGSPGGTGRPGGGGSFGSFGGGMSRGGGAGRRPGGSGGLGGSLGGSRGSSSRGGGGMSRGGGAGRRGR